MEAKDFDEWVCFILTNQLFIHIFLFIYLFYFIY